MSDGLHALGVAGLGRLMDAGEASSVEITSHLLARVAGHTQVGAFLCVDADAALAQARAADARRAAGECGALLGVPLAHKDIFVTAALPTTAGSKMLAGYRSPFDGPLVKRRPQPIEDVTGQQFRRRIRYRQKGAVAPRKDPSPTVVNDDHI